MMPPEALPCFNFYHHKKLDDDVFLLSVDSGDWKLLSAEEFESVKKESVSDLSFLAELKESFIYLDQENWTVYCEKLKMRYREVFMPPTLHIAVVTPQCNLRCIYCHAGLSQGEDAHMDIETADKVLESILDTPLSGMTLEIQGGEPTLNFQTVKFLVIEGKHRALERGKQLSFCIVSNFTSSLSDDMMRFFIENDVAVSTSIDGAQTIHENNRNLNYPCGFAVLRERITAFRQIWKTLRSDEPKLSAMLTATRPVLSQPRETVDAYIALGFHNLFLRPVNPIGRGDSQSAELSYTPEEFVDFWTRSIDYIIELYNKGVYVTEEHLCILLKKIFYYDNGYMDLRFPCGASFGQRAYNYDGSIYTCDEGRMLKEQNFKIGRLGDTSRQLNENRNGIDTFISSLSELSYCEFCVYKPYCGVCPILNWKESGHTISSVYGKRRCRIYRGMLDYVFKKFLSDDMFQEYTNKLVIDEIV